MTNDPSLFAGIGAAVVAYIFFTAAVTVLVFWIMYSVIWRAVRRGLREFHYPQQR